MQPYTVDVTAQITQKGDQLIRGTDVPEPSPVPPRRVPFQVGDALGGRAQRGVQCHLDLGEHARGTGAGGGRCDRRGVAALDESDVEPTREPGVRPTGCT